MTRAPRAMVVVVLAAVGGLPGCEEAPGDPKGITQPATVVSPLTEGPLAYFDDHCARCHGPQGAFYGPGMAERLQGEALREVVDEMAAGPAMAPLEGPALDAQVAFHRSLIDGRPFVAWTRNERGSLAGEVSSGASVRVRTAAGEEIGADVQGFVWAATVDGEPTTVIATLNGKTTTLDLRHAAHSHGGHGNGSSQ